MFKSVGLIARFDRRKAIRLTEDLARRLQERGLDVFIENTLLNKVQTTAKAIPLENMRTDFVVTIGGDGTILRTCISLPKPEPPILTVNMGVRAFLAEVEPEDVSTAIDRCLTDKFRLEKCTKLNIKADSLSFPDALNEVVVFPKEPTKLLYTSLNKDDKTIMDCQSDGVMVATQTGSTGYSLSAGGPVLDPEANTFVLTPICPLSAVRPIVFPAKSKLVVEVTKPRKIQVIIDGQYRRNMSSRRPRLVVTCSRNQTSFIRFTENFYERLRNRLLFKGIH